MLLNIIGDWGLGIGDWVNPQSPIPNTQSPKHKFLQIKFNNNSINQYLNYNYLY